MHSVKRILTTENRTCAIRPTAIQSSRASMKWPEKYDKKYDKGIRSLIM